ncbi:MAG: transcription elongation factor GreA [Oscillospiraceae bacterium]|nr:transcription elongation factor GreA [Oscillospiraceae bacterium]
MNSAKDEQLISKNKLIEYEKELEYLKSTRRKEIAETIKEARSHGDLSENSEYDEAKNTQAMVEARISEIEKMLQNAKVIDEDELTTDKVSIGCVVTAVFKYPEESERDTETYSIVSSSEADIDSGKISNESPVGKALIGHKVGDKLSIEVGGGIIDCEVLSIEKQSFS